MSEDKYYTPTIEEFRVGFDFEWKAYYEGGDPASEDFSWIQKTVVHPNDIPLKMFFEQGRVRVKFLDKQDIEELGFVQSGGKPVMPDSQYYTWNNGRYFVHIEVTEMSFGSVIRIETSVEETSIRTLVVHSITIRNKSELKKLLTQLGI